MQSMDSDAGEGLKMQSSFDHRRLLNAAADLCCLVSGSSRWMACAEQSAWRVLAVAATRKCMACVCKLCSCVLLHHQWCCMAELLEATSGPFLSPAAAAARPAQHSRCLLPPVMKVEVEAVPLATRCCVRIIVDMVGWATRRLQALAVCTTQSGPRDSGCGKCSTATAIFRPNLLVPHCRCALG